MTDCTILNDKLNIIREKRHRELEEILRIKYFVNEEIDKSLIDDFIYSSGVKVKVKGEQLITALKRDLSDLTKRVIELRKEIDICREVIIEDPTESDWCDGKSTNQIIDSSLKLYKLWEDDVTLVDEDAKRNYNNKVESLRWPLLSIQKIVAILPMIVKDKEYEVCPSVALKIQR